MDFIAMAEVLEAQAASLRRHAASIANEGQASLPLAEPEAGWVREWNEEGQPVATYGKLVEVELRGGARREGPAAAFVWEWADEANDPSDIVAYRVVADAE